MILMNDSTSSLPSNGIKDEHLDLIKKIAVKIKHQLNITVEIDELISLGFIGLKEAMIRYDPSKSAARFETFAFYRIRGAIYDGIAKQCCLNRHAARKLRLARKANDYMEEVAGEVKSIETNNIEMRSAFLSRIIKDLSSIYDFASLNIGVTEKENEDGEKEWEFVDKTAESKHEEAVQASEMRKLLQKLPHDQAKLIYLYYYEDNTLEEAGEKLGYTKSWASKLHNAAIKKLRSLVMEEKL